MALIRGVGKSNVIFLRAFTISQHEDVIPFLDAANEYGLLVVPTFPLKYFMMRTATYEMAQALERSFVEFVLKFCIKKSVKDENLQKCERLHPAVLMWTVDFIFPFNDIDDYDAFKDDVNKYFNYIANIQEAREYVEAYAATNCPPVHPLALGLSLDTTDNLDSEAIKENHRHQDYVLEKGSELNTPDIWIMHTNPTPQRTSPGSMVDRADVFQNPSFLEEKGLILRYGYPAVTHTILSNGNAGTLDEDLQAELTLESFQKMTNQRFNLTGVVIDEFNDRWYRYEGYSEESYDCNTGDYHHTHCGSSITYTYKNNNNDSSNGNSHATSSIVSVEYLGAVKQYDYWGLHCIQASDSIGLGDKLYTLCLHMCHTIISFE
eukprot:gene793-1269_t